MTLNRPSAYRPRELRTFKPEGEYCEIRVLIESRSVIAIARLARAFERYKRLTEKVARDAVNCYLRRMKLRTQKKRGAEMKPSESQPHRL